jgi:PAS domain S-box-containing protein
MRRALLDSPALRQMLYDALDASDDLVLVLEHVGESDDEFLIAASNEAFCRASGLDSETLTGKPFTALAARDTGVKNCQAVVAASRERRSFRSDMLCRRTAGTPFWFGLHLMPVPDSTPACSVILGRDITQQRRDRRQHAAIQSLLAKVFVSVQTPVAIVDELGAVLMNNPALDRLLGALPGSMAGKAAIGFVAPDCRDAVNRARQRQAETGEEYRIETRLLRADGSLVAVEAVSTIAEQEDLKRCRIFMVTPLSDSRLSDSKLPESKLTVSNVSDPKQPDSSPSESKPSESNLPEAKTPAESAIPRPMRVLVAGRIKLIGLEEVKASLGSRWPAMADRVLRSAEHIIRRRCGPQDTWCRTKDSSFVVSFADAGENEAAFRAAAIAREVRTRLIGEGETPATAYASAITATIEVPDVSGTTLDARNNLIGERLNVRLAEIEARARTTLAQAVHDASCEVSPVHAGAVGKIVAHFASLPRELEHQVQCALVALPLREAQEFDFDRLILATAAQQMVAKIASGGLRTMFVPVSFSVFQDRRILDRYLAACQALDERLRQHLVLTLTDTPQGVPRNRVLDCVLRLRPLCRTVCYQADNLEVPPIEFSLLGDSFIVTHEADLRQWDLDHLVKLEKLIGLAHAHRGRTLVRQVSDRAKAVRLLKLGVDFVALNDLRGAAER